MDKLDVAISEALWKMFNLGLVSGAFIAGMAILTFYIIYTAGKKNAKN